MTSSFVTRRAALRGAAAAAASSISAPFVKGAYAGGKLSFGSWSHFAPGANDALEKLCAEWALKNRVELQVDRITSIGAKMAITAAAEAQAGVGHDIMTHARLQIGIHRQALEPVDDVVARLSSDYGPFSSAAEYAAKHDGTWYGLPTTFGSQLQPCCSRIDLYKQYCGIDLTQIFPPNSNRDEALVDGWNWDLYLKTAEQLFKAGYPLGLPMGQTPDSIVWTAALFRSFGSVLVDGKDDIKVDSTETRTALEYLKKLMPLTPPDVYAWDDAGNNRWLISGRGSGIMNPPSAWAVAKRDNPKVAEQCWTHDMPRGPAGRYVGQLDFFYGIWNFSTNKAAAKDLLTFLSEKEQSRQLVAASSGFDLPPFKSFYDFDTWQKVEPPIGTLYNYPAHGDQQGAISGFPARIDVAARISEQALQPIMVAKVVQGRESIDDVIKWAERELEGFLRG